jgi:CheY-like chemotaxis protein
MPASRWPTLTHELTTTEPDPRPRYAEGPVLVVDDHDDSRTICRLALEMHGYAVVEARTGAEALAAVFTHRPQLVLLDILMPDFDGWEIARTLRAHPRTRSIHLVAVTALCRASDRAATLASGCDEVLTKPVLIRELVSVIHRYIGPARRRVS